MLLSIHRKQNDLETQIRYQILNSTFNVLKLYYIIGLLGSNIVLKEK